MKLGLSAGAFYGKMETEEQAALLSTGDYPIDTCELFLQCISEWNTEFGSLLKNSLKELPCDSIHPKGTLFENDLFSRSGRQREDAHRQFLGALEAGQAIGASFYVWHGPHSVHGPMSPGRIFELEKRFPVLQQEAREHGLEILWENVVWASLHSLDDLRLLKHLFPGLGYVLDIKQAGKMGVPWQTLLEEMGPQVRHVHVLDQAEDGRLCLPGEGIIDFRLMFRMLRQTGFNGVVLLEPYAAMAEDDQALRSSLLYLRECME